MYDIIQKDKWIFSLKKTQKGLKRDGIFVNTRSLLLFQSLKEKFQWNLAHVVPANEPNKTFFLTYPLQNMGCGGLKNNKGLEFQKIEKFCE